MFLAQNPNESSVRLRGPGEKDIWRSTRKRVKRVYCSYVVVTLLGQKIAFSPKMGYDTKRFKESDLKPDLICTICSDVFEDPVQRAKCEHFFCRICITNWLKKSTVCPIDREHLSARGLSDAPRLLRSLLADLDITCDFASQGCPAIVKLERLKQHLKECDFNPVTIVRCDKSCGASFTRRERGNHCCLTHLKGVNRKLEKSQKEAFAALEAERAEKTKLKSKLSLETNRFKREREELREKERKLIEENNDLKAEKERNRVLMKNLRNEVKKLEDEVREHSQGHSSGQRVKVDSHSAEMGRKRKEMLEKRVGQIMDSITHSNFFSNFYKCITEGLFRSWAPYLTEGANVLFAEDIISSSAYETIFLALMVGSKGRVTVMNPSDYFLSKVKMSHESLLSSGRIKVVNSKTREIYSTTPFDVLRYHGRISRVETYLISDQLKPGGALFSNDNVLEKQPNGEFKLCL